MAPCMFVNCSGITYMMVIENSNIERSPKRRFCWYSLVAIFSLYQKKHQICPLKYALMIIVS